MQTRIREYRQARRIAPMLAVIIAAGATRAVADGGVALEDIARIRSVSATVISPDGRYVAYTLSVPREPWKKGDGGDKVKDGPAWVELHVIDERGRSRPYVTGEVNVRSVKWTPDGKGISFLAKRGKDKHRCLYLIALDGGEARRVLAHTTDIGNYAWSPEDRRVAFLAKPKQDKARKKHKDIGFTQEVYEEDWRHTQVRLASPFKEPATKPTLLDLPGSASSLYWSPDGSSLAVVSAPTPLIDDGYMNKKIHIVDVASAEITGRVQTQGKLGRIAWSPDGKHLAIIAAVDRHDPQAGHVMVVPSAGGAARDLLPSYGGHISSIAWQDDDTVMYLGGEGVWTAIGEVRRDGTEHKNILEPGTHVLSGMTLSRDGKAAAFVGQNARHPAEVFRMRHGDTEPQRLTHTNLWLRDRRLAKQEVVRYRARDGLELEGLLIRPLDEQAGTRYPLVLIVHGGPESHNTNGWVTSYSRPGQALAAKGFAVFYPNYRGSTGRGVEFSKLGQADYAGKEFDDLIDAIDHLVAEGLVDKDRVGVTGGSYGGFASAWCATYHTERFAASVMFVGISDQISKFGTTDIPNEMYLVHARRHPWDDWDWFRERSPIYHAEKCRTPILIMHGKNDPRVHPSQSMELYRYLKTLGKTPVRLVLYAGEGHGNRKAAARLDYSMRMMRWMEHYLSGPGGDPPPYELNYAALDPDKDDSRDAGGGHVTADDDD